MLGEHIKVIRKARGLSVPDSDMLIAVSQTVLILCGIIRIRKVLCLARLFIFFEWLLVRAAPFIFAGTIAGAVITRKRE